MNIKAYAKVNLALDVIGKTASGYHEIQTVMYEITSLFDEIVFSPSNKNVGSKTVTFFCDDSRLIFDDKNTIVRAIRLFEEEFKIICVGHVELKKNIPMAAGLGGGSSDAAAILKMLAAYYNVPCCPIDTPDSLTTQTVERCHYPGCRLIYLATYIGMDTAFFINGGTQLARHFGEVLTPLPSITPFIECEIIDTKIAIDTSKAYQNLTLADCGKNRNKTEFLVAALCSEDSRKARSILLQNLHNDFEHTVFTCYPSIQKKALEIKQKYPCRRVILAGSGGALVVLT